MIYSNPAFRGPDGKFDRQLFTQVLMMNRLTEDQLVTRLRRDIPRTDLLQALTVGVVVPRPVVDVLYRYRNEKRLADIVAFPASAETDSGTPSETDLNKFYEAHPDLFRAPEYRGFTVAYLSPADLEQPGEISEDELKKEYEQRKDEFETPERREIQQILAPSEEKAKEAEAALAAGKDWKDVATTIGQQDPDTIDLGLLSRQEIPHELGDVAFKLPLNQPSQPVKTPLGWHVLRVVKIEPAATQSFEEAKAQIAKELQASGCGRPPRQDRQPGRRRARRRRLARRCAAKYHFKTATVAAADEGGRDPQGKAVALPAMSGEILKTVFAANQADTSRITDTEDRLDLRRPRRQGHPARGQAARRGQQPGGRRLAGRQKRAAATKQAEGLPPRSLPGC